MTASRLPDSQLLLTVIAAVCQTLTYGIFITTVAVAGHALSKHGIVIRPNTIIFSVTLLVFGLSTAYWAVSVCSAFSQLAPSHVFDDAGYRELFSATVLVNFLFADSVVVWRMTVLCRFHFSNVVFLPSCLGLGLTAFSVIATIVVRIMLNASSQPKDHPYGSLATGLNVSQVATSLFSLLTNITTTMIIWIWALQYRKSTVANLGAASTYSNSKVIRITALVVESGVIYCVSSMIALVAAFVHLPCGTLGDIYTGIHVQLAGMYPALVMILISSRRSSSERQSSTMLTVNVQHDISPAVSYR